MPNQDEILARRVASVRRENASWPSPAEGAAPARMKRFAKRPTFVEKKAPPHSGSREDCPSRSPSIPRVSISAKTKNLT
jgi:hypothetical protein